MELKFGGKNALYTRRIARAQFWPSDMVKFSILWSYMPSLGIKGQKTCEKVAVQ